MKRLFALLLTLVMLLSLAACGDDAGTNSGDDAASSQNETTKPKDTDVTEPSVTDANEPDDSGVTEPAPEDTTDDGETDFDEVIVVDNEECAIKITGIDADNLWGYTLNAQLENKSADKTYMFSVDSAAINSVQCDPMFAAEVAAGKKSNEEISFFTEDLDENGIGDYTDIELTFRVYDSDDWMADPVAEETVHIYPYGEDRAVRFERESQPTDNVIVDNEYVTVIVTGYEHDEIWGYSVNLFLLNKSDKNIMLTAEEVSVNGLMLDPFYATLVTAGKCEFSAMSWYDSDLADNDITEVEEIEFQLGIYDNDDWFGGEFVRETITLTP